MSASNFPTFHPKRFVLETTDGRRLEKQADKRYRGGPSKSMLDAEVEAKFKICSEGMLSPKQQQKMIATIWSVSTLDNSATLFDILSDIGR